MKDFLFTPEQARTPLRVLSGGERARLMLARSLARPSNLLVLDEPTNDLDLETLDVLEEMLGDYQGTVILISHDRDFLDRVVERVIAPDGQGKWAIYAGGYSDMLAQRGADLPAREEKSSSGGAKAAVKNSVRTTPSPTVPAAEERRKFSFTERHQLETLPKTIEKLRGAIRKLNAKLTDPDYFTRDPTGFGEASTLLAKAMTELATQEERWLELEMLREELES
jgi:ATP-binding cassette subfamily F protein uup